MCSVRSVGKDRPHRRELSALRSRPSLPPDLPPRRGGSRCRRPPLTAPERTKALVSLLTRASTAGVSDGARTRDTQDHNLVLYQLSYTHHVSRPDASAGGNGSNDTGAGQ